MPPAPTAPGPRCWLCLAAGIVVAIAITWIAPGLVKDLGASRGVAGLAATLLALFAVAGGVIAAEIVWARMRLQGEDDAVRPDGLRETRGVLACAGLATTVLAGYAIAKWLPDGLRSLHVA